MRWCLSTLLLVGALVSPAGAGAAVVHEQGLQKVVYHSNGLVVVKGTIQGPGTFTWYFDAATVVGAVQCQPYLANPQDSGLTPCSPCLHAEAQPIYTLGGVEVPVTRRFKKKGLHRFRIAVVMPAGGAVFVSSSTFPMRTWGPPNDPTRFSCNDEAGLL